MLKALSRIFLAIRWSPTRRVFPIEVVVADGVVLPAHRVVQGVHSGVAPVPVEVVLGQGGLAAGQFEQGGAGGEETSVLIARASATAMEAAATLSALLSSRARSRNSPARSSKASAACRRMAR